MARDRYGLIQPEQKLTYYPMYAFICLLTLESIWYHYLAFGRQILTPENVEFDEIPENLELDLSGPRRYYENWSSSLTMAPKKIFAPSNAREIVQVVQLARKYKQTVSPWALWLLRCSCQCERLCDSSGPSAGSSDRKRSDEQQQPPQ